MGVTPGGRLGAYTVRELIGAGGMGEVYLGHDALASLSHPNIASIFGLEESNGVQALVLEFYDDCPADARAF